MENLRTIYLKNLGFTLVSFVTGFVLLFIQGNAIAQFMLLVLWGLMYCYIFTLIRDLINHVSKKETSVFELRFLFITLAVSFGGIYFFISVLDVNENMISGVREMQGDIVEVERSINGLILYSRELLFTYLNSLYYSVTIMTTLGDSSINAESGLTRLFVAFEVGMTLSITVFKIGDFYSEKSSAEVKGMKQELIEEIKTNNSGGNSKRGFFRRLFTRHFY